MLKICLQQIDKRPVRMHDDPESCPIPAFPDRIPMMFAGIE